MPRRQKPDTETVIATFVDMYDESLEAVGQPRLTPGQRDVLRGMLAALQERKTERQRSQLLKMLETLPEQ